jgi:glycosyltransferase involved in cell wall biosynthesis
MKDKLFFTVIIPALNEEKFLPRLLCNIAKQTYKNFEVLVVDGKSTDNTVKVAKQYENKITNFRILTSDIKNVSIQRNLGAKNAVGEYLVFFDADVQIPANFLKLVFEHIQKKKSLLLTTWIKTDAEDSEDLIVAAVTNIGSEAAKIIERPFAGGYNTIVLKSVFEHMGGFNSKIFHGEDHDFTIRCYEAGIKLDIMRKPRVTFSMRRFKKYGYFSILKKDTKSAVYTVLRKPLTKAIFEYPMGGEIYKQKINVTKENAHKFENSLVKSIRKFLAN